MLARILFAILAATAGIAEAEEGCDPFVTLGDGTAGTLYLTGGLSVYEESNGVAGLQRGCRGDAPGVGDRLVS